MLELAEEGACALTGSEFRDRVQAAAQRRPEAAPARHRAAEEAEVEARPPSMTACADHRVLQGHHRRRRAGDASSAAVAAMSAAPTPQPHADLDLVYLCDWLPPDFGAVGQYSAQFARERARRGEAVALYGLSSEKSSVEEETVGRGRVKTVASPGRAIRPGRFRQRARWTLRTNLSLLGALRRHAPLPTKYCSPAARRSCCTMVPLNVVLRKRLTYRITDFYPECLMAETRGFR